MTEIRCASGMAFEAKDLGVKDLSRFVTAHEKNDADGGLTRVLKECWIDLIDPGPYPSLKNGATAPDWKKILDGDVISALYQMRTAGIDDEYKFPFSCERCKRQQPRRAVVKLSQFDIVPLPDESRKKLEASETFVATMLSGEKVRFELGTNGQHEALRQAKRRLKERLEKKRDPDAATIMRPQLYDAVARQVVHVEQLGDKNRDPLARLDWASSLSLKEFYHLHSQMEEADCGIDTAIMARCQFDNCGWEQENLNVPLDGDFFRPPSPEAMRRLEKRKMAPEVETDEPNAS